MPKAKNYVSWTINGVKALKPRTSRVRYYAKDLAGLYVAVTPAGNKTFYFAYQCPETRKSIEHKLGRFPTLQPGDAAKAATGFAAVVARGESPQVQARERERDAAAQEALAVQAEKYTLEYQLSNESSAWRRYVKIRGVKRWEDTEKLLRKHFGHWLNTPFVQIKRSDLIEWVHEKLAEGKLKPGGINRPIKHFGSVLTRVRNADETFTHNPFQGLSEHLPKEPTSRVRYLSAEERKAFLKALENAPDYMQLVCKVLMTTGMRKMELLGARWHQLQKDGDKHYLVLSEAQTKTDRARKVPIPSNVAKALLEWKLKNKGRDSHYMFYSPTIKGVGLVNIQKQFQAILSEAGITDFRVHDLRHTAATQMLQDGVPVHIIADILGHSNITTTMTRYAHVIPQDTHDRMSEALRDDIKF